MTDVYECHDCGGTRLTVELFEDNHDGAALLKKRGLVLGTLRCGACGETQNGGVTISVTKSAALFLGRALIEEIGRELGVDDATRAESRRGLG